MIIIQYESLIHINAARQMTPYFMLEPDTVPVFVIYWTDVTLELY